jgi:co-chaperonin GroES (HSP10)
MKVQKISMDSDNFQPKKEYVLIKPDDIEKETETGLIVSTSIDVVKKPTSGIVIALGNDEESVVIGDYVIYPDVAGFEMEFNDGQFVLVKYESILGSKK